MIQSVLRRTHSVARDDCRCKFRSCFRIKMTGRTAFLKFGRLIVHHPQQTYAALTESRLFWLPVRSYGHHYIARAEFWYFIDTEGNLDQFRRRKRRLTPAEIEERNPTDKFSLLNVENLLKETVGDLPMAEIPNPYAKEHEKCVLCKYNIPVDYKNSRLLSQFISRFTGRIYERQTTGLCKLQDENIRLAIKMSRTAGYLPYMYTEPIFYHDPRLFDPFNPKRKS